MGGGGGGGSEVLGRRREGGCWPTAASGTMGLVRTPLHVVLQPPDN